MSSIRSAVPFVDYRYAAGDRRIAAVDPERGGSEQVAGVSASWRRLMLQAEMVAPHLQVAVIEGEAGVGKHTLAHYIFSRSSSGGANFERRDAREWLAADGEAEALSGFLYLDRVDLLAAPGQNLLLRVVRALQDREPGGAVLLASSESSLRQMASQGMLLPELAFRLTGVRFAVPPLRHRREDIAPLSQVLLERLCARYKQRPVVLGAGALARLLEHDWPGNVRELSGVLEAALLEAANGVIRPGDLAVDGAAEPRQGEQTRAEAEDLSLDASIRRHVRYVLDLNCGNKLRAARQLGISRSTLYRLLGTGE